MNIYAISDLHGNLPKIPNDADLVIVAGDVCPVWDHAAHYQRNWLRDEFTSWLESTDAHIIGIGGNHDFVIEREPWIVGGLPWTYLRDSEIEIEGLRIYGTPWVPNLPSWAFHMDMPRLEMRARAIPEGLDILVSHGPPYGIADVVGPKWGSINSMHVGDQALLNRLRTMDNPPSITICGHIHEERGYYEEDIPWAGVLYNVSMLDDNYDVVGGFEKIYQEDPIV